SSVLRVELECTTRVFGGLLALFLAQREIAGPLLEEVDERGVQMAKRLLGWHTGDFVEPGVPRGPLQLGQRRGRLMVADRGARLMGVGPELESPVVDEAAAAERAGESLFLLVGRIAPEFISSFHMGVISRVRLYRQLINGLLPMAEARGFRPWGI